MPCTIRRLVVTFCLAAAIWSPLSLAAGATTFRLQAVQSKEIYGPFAFKPAARIRLESGTFTLQVVAGRSFRLVAADAKGKVYGVYELVPGRMIDIGDVLFSITDIKAPATATAAPTASANTKQGKARGFFADSAIALEVDLLNAVSYEWKIDGTGGESDEDMERKSASLRFSKNHMTARIGIITAADWDNTIAGDGSTFENATIEEGSGWIVGIGVDVPIFEDGRWSARVFGEASYRQEELSLQYGAWEVQSITSTTVTNGGSNVVTTTTNLGYVNYDEDATLTETLVLLGAAITYEAPAWFVYAGIKTLPWEDTSLDATVKAGSSNLDIELERKDPVMVYGGLGFVLAGTKCYLEVEGGGESAVRLGLLKEL